MKAENDGDEMRQAEQLHPTLDLGYITNFDDLVLVIDTT